KAPIDSTALRLGAQPALLIKDTGRDRALRGLRLLGVGLLFLRRLLLFLLLLWPGLLLLLWPGLLHRLPALRGPLWQLPKTGPYGLRDALMQGLTQEGPGTRRLFCLRRLRLRGALGGAWPLLLGRLP